jgi:hypothetical protein
MTSRSCPRSLRAQVEELLLENHRLRMELGFLRENPAIAKGLKGESLIASLLSLKHSRRGAGHDPQSRTGKVLFEIKYSSLLRAIGDRPIRRWVWTKLFGELGRKKYHRLLLIGDADPRFQPHYLDPNSPYVMFDLPYKHVVELAGGVRHGRAGQFQLTTNPRSVLSSRAQALFQVFQVSSAILKDRYPDITSVGEWESNLRFKKTRRTRRAFDLIR